MTSELPAGGRVANYVRVSTEEQKEGWSTADQEDTLAEVAESRGWKLAAVCRDLGDSGMFLDRIGMDEARDLAESGAIDAVVALYRSRIGRKNSHVEYLRKWFKNRGVKLIALNTQNDESPGGFLQDNVQGIFDEYEALAIRDRMRRGKLRRAREGFVVGNHTPNYGFRFAATKSRGGKEEKGDTLVPDPVCAPLVRRIFKMVGPEGYALHAVKKVFDGEGIPTPGSKSPGISGACAYWQQTFLGRLIEEDLYYPHTESELDALVAEGVLASPVREAWRGRGPAGIWWFNTVKHEPLDKRLAYTKSDGAKGYKTKYKRTPRPRSEWVAVPVEAIDVPREWVLQARERVKDNVKPARQDEARTWELSGGITVCGHCRRRVYTNLLTPKKAYYRCPSVRDNGYGACAGGNWNAKYVEPLVWEFVKRLMAESAVVLAAVDATIEREQARDRGGVEEDWQFWHDHLQKTESKVERYVEMYADGVVTKAKRDEKLAALKVQEKAARSELDALVNRKGRVEALKQDRRSLEESYKSKGLRGLEIANGEHRRRLYEILGIRVDLFKDEGAEVKRYAGSDISVRVKGRIVEAVWGGEGCTFRDAHEISSMYNFTNRMSLACGKIPNEEYHALFR